MPKTDQTVQAIYQNTVGNLSISDRLRLGALILNFCRAILIGIWVP